jgi:hypothetical protein
MSSSDSILITATLAIDLYNLVSSTFLAWEDGSSVPPHAPSEDIESLGHLPRIKAFPVGLLQDRLHSAVHDRMSPSVISYGLYKKTKMQRADAEEADRRRSVDVGDGATSHQYLVDSRSRGTDSSVERNERGFREKTFTELLDIDPQLETIIFGRLYSLQIELFGSKCCGYRHIEERCLAEHTGSEYEESVAQLRSCAR